MDKLNYTAIIFNKTHPEESRKVNQEWENKFVTPMTDKRLMSRIY
jgi:hypothetical protein